MAHQAPAPAPSGRRVTRGLTFDTGALIGLERRHQRIARVYATAVADRVLITVPAVSVAEWWRGRTAGRDVILRGVRVEDMNTSIAKLAGEALASVPRATAI